MEYEQVRETIMLPIPLYCVHEGCAFSLRQGVLEARLEAINGRHLSTIISTLHYTPRPDDHEVHDRVSVDADVVQVQESEIAEFTFSKEGRGEEVLRLILLGTSPTVMSFQRCFH